MKTTLGLKNFRIFDEKGVSIHINPLTVLTGCNSSGKSSIVKALILLNKFLKGVRESAPGAEPRLEFDKKPLSLLGNFESIVNKNATDNKQITLSYTVDSLYLGKETTIELTFETQANDIRKDGFLKEVAIKDAEGNLLYHGTGYLGIMRFFPNNDTFGIPDDILGIISQDLPSDPVSVKSLKTRYFAYRLIASELDHHGFVVLDEEIIQKISSPEEFRLMEEPFVNAIRNIANKTSKTLVVNALDWYSRNPSLGGGGDRGVFKTNASLVELAMQSNIITYLPVLDVLDSISKDDFGVQFKALCFDGISLTDREQQYREGLVDSIIYDFTLGDYRVFSDYYRKLENDFLEKGTMMRTSQGSTGMQLAIPEREVFRSFYEHHEAFIQIDGIVLPDTHKEPAVESFDYRGNVSLEQVFYLLTSIKNRPKDDDFIISKYDDRLFVEIRDHRILRDYMGFRHSAIKDVFTIDICNSLRYVGSNRIEIKRSYSLDIQDNFTHTVSEYFEATRCHKKNDKYTPGDFINRWVQIFGIGQRLSISSFSDGIGLVMKIYQSEEDTDGRILADYGYGISQLVSILIEIENAILQVKFEFPPKCLDFEKPSFNLSNLWHYRQMRPIPISIAIEEPEIHLHPKYQSLLADMFVDAFLNYGIHFIVETHSEYLIRKLQNHVAKGTIKPDVLSFLYVEDGNDSEKKVREIGIAEDGRLTSAFGPGFFDEADSLAMNLLKIKGGLL